MWQQHDSIIALLSYCIIVVSLLLYIWEENIARRSTLSVVLRTTVSHPLIRRDAGDCAGELPPAVRLNAVDGRTGTGNRKELVSKDSTARTSSDAAWYPIIALSRSFVDTTVISPSDIADRLVLKASECVALPLTPTSYMCSDVSPSLGGRVSSTT